jgi:tetratricopeptide (TPR) repeat protein
MKSRQLYLAATACIAIGGATVLRGHFDQRNHQSAEQHFNASDDLEKQGRIPEAIEEMKLAIRDDPKYFAARQGLCDLYEIQQRIPEAIAVLQEGLRAAPADQDRYHYALCQVYEGEKDYPDALQQIRLSLKAEPDDLHDQRMLPMLLEKAGQYAGAEQAWKEYIRKHPGDTTGERGLRRASRLKAHPPHASGLASSSEAGVTRP